MPQSTELGRVVKTIYPVSETLTISSGAVTVEAAKHIIAAESGTADDLETINGGEDFEIISIYADTGDTITVVETGNINLGGSDFTLTSSNRLLLEYDGSEWIAINASSNAGGGGSGIGATQTYTPTVTYSSAGSVTGYTTQIGRYVELSSNLFWVGVELAINTTTGTTTGQARVSLPFTLAAEPQDQVLPLLADGLNYGTTNQPQVNMLGLQSTNYIYPVYFTRTGGLLNANLQAGDTIYFSGVLLK